MKKLFYDKDGNSSRYAANEIEGFLSTARDGAAPPRDGQVRLHLHRRLLPSRCPGTPCAVSSTTPPKSSARDGLPEREGPPRRWLLPVRDELLLHRGPLIVSDQIQLYKLLCRQVAQNWLT